MHNNNNLFSDRLYVHCSNFYIVHQHSMCHNLYLMANVTQTGTELAHRDFHIRHSASTNIVASVLIDTALAAYRKCMFRGTTETKGQRALALTGVLPNLSGREGRGSYMICTVMEASKSGPQRLVGRGRSAARWPAGLVF